MTSRRVTARITTAKPKASARSVAWAARSRLKVKDGKVKYVEGINGPANEGRLCVKGRFGFDYIHHPHRLTKPLIRREDAPEKGLNVDPGDLSTHFREATWEEAMDLASVETGWPCAPKTRAALRALVLPNAPTKKRTCSRSSSGRVSSTTTSTTAPACATLRRWRR